VEDSQGSVRIDDLRSALQEKLKRFSGLILYVLITILVLTLYLGKYGFLERLSVQMQDGMFRLRGETDSLPGEMVIVGIDNRSVDLVGKWPWGRDILAQLVYIISQGEPKVLGLDLFLPEQVDEDTSGRTELLAYYVRAAAEVVVPIYFSLSDVGIAPQTVPDRIRRSAVGTDKDLGRPAASLVSAKQIYCPSSALIEASSWFGHINIDYDKDGLIRQEPLLICYDGYLYPSFGMQLAREYLKGTDSEPRLLKEGGVTIGGIAIPADERHRARLNYLGPNLSFQRISAVEVLGGEVDPETFAGKIVLVGLTTTESKTWMKVPAFGEMNEVERIATVAHNIIHHGLLKSLLPIWSVLIMVLIGVFCAVVLPKVSLTHRIVILLVFLFVVFNLSYILFSSFGTLTKPAYPILELVFFLVVAPAIRAEGTRKRSEGEKLEEMEEVQAVDESELASEVTAGEPAEPIGQESTPIVIKVPRDEEAQDGLSETPGSKTEKLSRQESAKEETAKLSASPTGSTPSGTSPTPLPGGESPSFSRFGRYKIIETIGKGGMGMVYKGTDPMLDRPVALKTIRLDFPLSPTETAELKSRLIQEAKAAGMLSHPNIVTIYDVGEQEGLHYIAMEYLSGYSLEDFIKKKGELNYRIVARIVIQTCEALSYAHQHGIVHRDIKPANIMLLEDFHVKVMDFGIARLETTSLTKSNVALGTPQYISPEQLEGRQADKRSDIFSLGAVLYEMLTRRKPFQGENISSLMYRVLNYDPPPPSTINEKTPLIFDRIVSKAMAKKPEERYQNADEISQTLAEFVSSFVVTRGIRI
jgi:CHASE2 domain-containing sensor protein/predicted Ser/Thr protein kinase